jgi:hypothetical protein
MHAALGFMPPLADISSLFNRGTLQRQQPVSHAKRQAFRQAGRAGDQLPPGAQPLVPVCVHPNVKELEALCARGRAAIATNDVVELLAVDDLYGQGVEAKKFKGSTPDDITRVRQAVTSLLAATGYDPST